MILSSNRLASKAPTPGVLPPDLGFLMYVLGSGFFKPRTGVFKVKIDYIIQGRVSYFMTTMTVLPHSTAGVERIFSQINLTQFLRQEIVVLHCEQKQLKIEYLPSKQAIRRNLHIAAGSPVKN